MDRGDDGLVGGVDDLEGLAVNTSDKLVVDEANRNEPWSAFFFSHTATVRRHQERGTYRPVGCSYSPVNGVLRVAEVAIVVKQSIGIQLGVSRKGCLRGKSVQSRTG